jgi:hypothetical protein
MNIVAGFQYSFIYLYFKKFQVVSLDLAWGLQFSDFYGTYAVIAKHSFVLKRVRQI